MNYDLEWLNSTGFFTIDLGLSRVEHLLEQLGNPQNRLKFIHVAGSNGKGSVCSLTESALRAAGYRTGFYCSPHLVRLNERFRINGVPVSDEIFIRAAEKVRFSVEKLREEKEFPTYFEITTAIALELFVQESVDFVIWETGLGGRLDATNVVLPEVSVITGVSLEHTAFLGNTIAEVAREKAGIIKENIPVVCGPVSAEAFQVISSHAKVRNAELTAVGPYTGEYCIDRNALCQELQVGEDRFSVGLPGAYQRNNAVVAYHVLKILAKKYHFDYKKALSGYKTARWPARFQFVPEKKLLIDGAHNPEGMQALSAALREFFPGEKFHFLAGCFADKNAEEVVAAFAPLAKEVSFLYFDGAGRDICDPETLGAFLQQSAPGVPWRQCHLSEALSEVSGFSDMTVLCGSLHLCGEALSILGLNG